MSDHDLQTLRRLARAEHDELTQDDVYPLGDALSALWQSTAAFHQRFDRFPPQLVAAIDVLHEEFNEFLAEAIARPVQQENLAEEGVDLIVTMMGVLMAANVPLAMLHDKIQAVIRKNDAKTTQTHAVNAAGKIARKKAQPYE